MATNTNTETFNITEIAGGAGVHDFEIHAADCSDLNKSKYSLSNRWTANVTSIDGYIAQEVAEYEANGQGWTAEHYKVHKCARDA